MTLRIWLKNATINETIVLLHQIASYGGEASQVELEASHLKIILDLASYTEDTSEQSSTLEELVNALTSLPIIEKVERV